MSLILVAVRENEYFHYAKPDFYIGVDLHPVQLALPHGMTIMGDYRHSFEFLKRMINLYSISAVVSLFSVECTATKKVNREFYKEFFKIPSIKAVLSVGFHYSDKMGSELVTETGNLVSFQVFDDSLSKTKKWTEVRSVVPCPSKLFGETPVEVWRVLRRT